MSKDRFPQPVSFQVLLTGTGTDSLGHEIEFPLVLPRAETASTRIVTEVLKVVWDLNRNIHGHAADNTGFRASLSYRALTAAENDHLVPTATVGHEAVLTTVGTTVNLATVVGFQITPHTITQELGSGGFGLIFPGNKLFVNFSGNSFFAATVGCEIYYRQHLVGLTEFMGILATRQQQ